MPADLSTDEARRRADAALAEWGCPRPDKHHYLTEQHATAGLAREKRRHDDHDPTVHTSPVPLRRVGVGTPTNHQGDTVTDNTDTRWWHQAACQGAPDATFFPADGMDPAYRRAAARDALAICATCPVRLACLDDAMREERWKAATGRHGVRGGLTSDDRANLERRVARASAGGAA